MDADNFKVDIEGFFALDGYSLDDLEEIQKIESFKDVPSSIKEIVPILREKLCEDIESRDRQSLFYSELEENLFWLPKNPDGSLTEKSEFFLNEVAKKIEILVKNGCKDIETNFSPYCENNEQILGFDYILSLECNYRLICKEVFGKDFEYMYYQIDETDKVISEALCLYENRTDVFDDKDYAKDIVFLKDFEKENDAYKLAVARSFNLMDSHIYNEQTISILNFATETLNHLEERISHFDLEQRMMNPDDYIFEDR